MATIIEPISRLAAQLGRLPGIGSKTALRLAYHILDVPKEQAASLANAILEARETVVPCPVCGGYTDDIPCTLCKDASRNASLICVVQEAKDIQAMEKARVFRGQYHVLGGVISPMDGIGPEDIRIDELLTRVKEDGIREVILATNPDVEGEATATYIAKLLRRQSDSVQTTRIAHGIPIGGHLEYTDGVTLAKALEGRREL